MKAKLFLGILVFAAVGSFGQTSESASGKLDVLQTQSEQNTLTSIPGVTSTALESKYVDLKTPSSIEAMYARFSTEISQFGYSTFVGKITTGPARGRTPEPYTIGPGDQLSILLWGDPVDLGDLKPLNSGYVQADGTFFYAPAGLIKVDGLLRSDVEKIMTAALAKKYKRFDLRLQVTPQRIFPLTVTGLVAQPGLVMVDAWASVTEVLMQVGGVRKNGTLRDLRLIKSDHREISIDLYDLLVRAQKPTIKFEEGDVLWVGPIGKTVAVYGEVKSPGIFEIKATDTMADVVGFAGGLLPSSNGAPLNRVTWSDGAWLQSSVVWNDATALSIKPKDGDAFWFEGPISVKSSTQQPRHVKVDGEVTSPGFIDWTPGMTLAQALDRSGGVLDTGLLAGLSLTRSNVAQIQKKQIEAAILSNKNQIASLTAKMAAGGDPVLLAAFSSELTARTEANDLLNATLKNGSLGRILLDDPTKGENVPLQPGDAIYVPRQDGVVLLLGEVYNPGAQVWRPGMTVRNAIDAVGGANSYGNLDAVYVLKTSGKVESIASRGNFFGFSPLWGEPLLPGDIIYIPTKRGDDSRSWSVFKDVIGIISQTASTISNVYVVLITTGILAKP